MNPLSVFKQIGGPGSIGFLALGTVIGVLFLLFWRRRRRLWRAWLIALFGTYIVLSVPIVANAIASSLPAVQTADAATLVPVDVLMVLDGDNRLGRARVAFKMANESPRAVVWVIGEWWMVEHLANEGVRRDRMKLDANLLTTLDQMEHVNNVLAARHLGRVALIASRLQMPRVAALMKMKTKTTGTQLFLIASPIDNEPPTSGFRLFIPAYIALRVSRDAIYEHAALAYYHWRGWI